MQQTSRTTNPNRLSHTVSTRIPHNSGQAGGPGLLLVAGLRGRTARLGRSVDSLAWPHESLRSARLSSGTSLCRSRSSRRLGTPTAMRATSARKLAEALGVSETAVRKAPASALIRRKMNRNRLDADLRDVSSVRQQLAVGMPIKAAEAPHRNRSASLRAARVVRKSPTAPAGRLGGRSSIPCRRSLISWFICGVCPRRLWRRSLPRSVASCRW